MDAKFSKGDRDTMVDAEVGARLNTASCQGAIVQGDPDHGDEGTYQVMFDGENLPQWVSGRSLRLSKG